MSPNLDSELHAAILGILLAVACASDVAARRIPNALVAFLAAAGVVARFQAGGFLAAGAGLLGGLAVLALLALPWASGKLGGGDVKLAAAAAIWVPASLLPHMLLYAGVVGIPLALSVRFRRSARSWRGIAAPAGAIAASPATDTVPLAVAISLGVFAVLAWGVP